MVCFLLVRGETKAVFLLSGSTICSFTRANFHGYSFLATEALLRSMREWGDCTGRLQDTVHNLWLDVKQQHQQLLRGPSTATVHLGTADNAVHVTFPLKSRPRIYPARAF